MPLSRRPLSKLEYLFRRQRQKIIRHLRRAPIQILRPQYPLFRGSRRRLPWASRVRNRVALLLVARSRPIQRTRTQAPVPRRLRYVWTLTPVKFRRVPHQRPHASPDGRKWFVVSLHKARSGSSCPGLFSALPQPRQPRFSGGAHADRRRTFPTFCSLLRPSAFSNFPDAAIGCGNALPAAHDM